MARLPVVHVMMGPTSSCDESQMCGYIMRDPSVQCDQTVHSISARMPDDGSLLREMCPQACDNCPPPGAPGTHGAPSQEANGATVTVHGVAVPAAVKVRVGLGRIVALYYCSTIFYRDR
jgi:hypothetical protein